MITSSSTDRRYLPDLTRRFRADGATGVARDRLSGRNVFLKRGHVDAIARELAVSLILPPDVAPRPLDFLVDPDGNATLVMEHLEGVTLLEHAARANESDIPELVLDVCARLAAMHRLGLVHGDLKPSNILVLSETGEAGGRTRLLDLESALGSLAGEPLNDGRQIVGTPGFAAPEILKGWCADARADLYSLGMTLRVLFPRLVSDPHWAPLLDGLTASSPSRRIADTATLVDQIRERFAHATPPATTPTIPSGPLRGRDAILLRTLEMSRASGCVLLQAWPGAGLSRLLLEIARRSARDGGRPVRIVDLGGGHAHDADALDAIVSEHSTAGHPFVIGVPDASPGLRWLPAPLASLLRTLEPRRAPRVVVPPLDGASFADLLATSLDPRAPSIDAIPRTLYAALILAARAATGTPAETMRELFATFDAPDGLDALIDAGLLVPDGASGLRFATRRLRRASLTEPLEREADVQAWLHRWLEPSLDLAEPVLEACARARALGDTRREAELLGRAIQRMRESHRWDQLLELMAQSERDDDPADMFWNMLGVTSIATRLARQLGAPWTAARLRLTAAEALKASDPALAIELWETVADDSDPAAAAAALVLLAENDLRRCDDAAFERRCEQIAAAALPVPAGVIELKRAWQAQNHGDLAGGEALARTAVERLRGTGSPHEVLAFQQLATLRFACDHREGIALMRESLAAARTTTQRAQVYTNLALMSAKAGDPVGCAAAADAGLLALAAGEQPRLESLLRERRAWAWAALDRIRDAWPEAQALLGQRAVAAEPTRRVVVRILSGFCALHRGVTATALTELVTAWRESRAGCPPDLRASALGWLVDALLATQAWELVETLGDELDPGAGPTTPVLELIAARAISLRALARDDPRAAFAALMPLTRRARRELEPEDAARWLHQLAIVRERAGEPEGAARTFGKALTMLPALGHGYDRGRILLARAAVLGRIGSPQATATLDRAIALARAIEARGLLAECLAQRAHLAMREPPPVIELEETR